MRHRAIGFGVGLLIFLVTLVAGMIVHSRFAPERVWLSTTSPNQKYTVELTGDKGRGGILFYSTVKYNILVNGEVVTRDRVVHYGDAMDISFELAYPEHAWIDANILRFWSNRHRREDNLDTLLISNNTDKVIKSLRIKTHELFFVFDLQPRSELKVESTHRSEGTGISVEGQFEDGSHIDYGVGFLDNGSREALGYCMIIGYQTVTINSPRQRGYDRRGNWNNLNIGAAPECVPYK
jgi:hypothetical protein